MTIRVTRFLGILLLITTIHLQSNLWATTLEVSNAPENDLGLTLKAIQEAKKTITLNIYELTSQDITKALIKKIHAGVQVRILEEGSPVGGLSAAGKEVRNQLIEAMKTAQNKSSFYEMKTQKPYHRRFRFDHAKYIVTDKEKLLLGSENYSPTGQPARGAKGNRGWEVYVYDSSLAQDFNTVFENDISPQFHDVRNLTQTPDTFLLSDLISLPGLKSSSVQNSPETLSENPSGLDLDIENTVDLSRAPALLNASDIRQILSPDNSLPELVQMIQSAHESLDLELLSFYSDWTADEPESPLLNEVLEAARRGVKVRVLLNDETVFNHSHDPSTGKNWQTMSLLNDAAKKEHLDMTARIANLKAMGITYIHNKGVLIDNDLTLVSSINWNSTSVMKNREAALLISGSDISAYYKNLFEKDWLNTQDESIAGQPDSNPKPPTPISVPNPSPNPNPGTDPDHALAIPSCMDHGNALPLINETVERWKHETPNQYLARAHVQGKIVDIYPDKNGHQHFAIDLGNGTPQTSDDLEVVYNEDFGALPALKIGMNIEVCGDYITSTAPAGPYPKSPVGAIIHWIHKSSNLKRHESGYLMINGVVYGQKLGRG